MKRLFFTLLALFISFPLFSQRLNGKWQKMIQSIKINDGIEYRFSYDEKNNLKSIVRIDKAIDITDGKRKVDRTQKYVKSGNNIYYFSFGSDNRPDRYEKANIKLNSDGKISLLERESLSKLAQNNGLTQSYDFEYKNGEIVKIGRKVIQQSGTKEKYIAQEYYVFEIERNEDNLLLRSELYANLHSKDYMLPAQMWDQNIGNLKKMSTMFSVDFKYDGVVNDTNIGLFGVFYSAITMVSMDDFLRYTEWVGLRENFCINSYDIRVGYRFELSYKYDSKGNICKIDVLRGGTKIREVEIKYIM